MECDCDCCKVKNEEVATLVAALEKAHALLVCVAGVVRDGEQRMPVGVHAPDGQGGVARYLTASFVKKCADWCEGEFSPCEAHLQKDAAS